MDEDLQTLRELSLKAQSILVEQRKAADPPHVSYSVGDLILWNPRESPCDHLSSKLSPTWTGPFEVISHFKNDIKCSHIAMNNTVVLHSERVKPFFGTYEEALALALLDNNQFNIVSINYFTGNPFLRKSMSFNVTFFDKNGNDTVNLDYNADFVESQQYHDYVASQPILYPLRGRLQRPTLKDIALQRKSSIEGYTIG